MSCSPRIIPGRFVSPAALHLVRPAFPSASHFCLALIWSVFFCLPLFAQTQATAERMFNLPADTAEKTLKLFSQQSGRALIMGAAAVNGVRTNEVKGEFTPRHALDRMLANTGLEAVEDAKSGSLGVRKATNLSSKTDVPPADASADAKKKTTDTQQRKR